MMNAAQWEKRWGPTFEIQVAKAMGEADAGHGLDHVRRVVANGKKLCLKEEAQIDIVLAACWLHDCVITPKDSPQRSQASRLAAIKGREIMATIGYPEVWYDAISHAIEAHSFSAGISCRSIEAKIVQDADRLEALGAIGIARCLQTGGSLGQRLYDPQEPFPIDRPLDDKQQSIDHFFAKLFRLPNTMQTEEGRSEALQRTSIMVEFLRSLCREIDGSEEELFHALRAIGIP